MTLEQIVALEALHEAATSAPWFVEELNDDLAMSAVVVSAGPLLHEKRAGDNWYSAGMVTGCLVQGAGRVSSGDGRWNENADLIAAMRNALPDLLRTARQTLNAGGADKGK